MKKVNTRALAESAVLIAMAFVLSYVRLYHFPYGGSVTAVSMLPLLVIGMRRGAFWGFCAGIVYGLLQLLQEGGLASPARSLGNLTFELFFDYIFAFGVLGLAYLFRKLKRGLVASVPVCLALRYLCHVVSGIVVWYPYAWEGWGVVPYSFAYNGSFMGAELVLTLIAAVALTGALPRFFTPQEA